MKITLATLLEGTQYTPVPGNEYEIAEGVWGVLRPPTAELNDEVQALLDGEDYTDLAGCKKVLKGLKAIDEKKLIPGMPSMVMRDFFSMLTRIGVTLSAWSTPSVPSEAAPQA